MNDKARDKNHTRTRNDNETLRALHGNMEVNTEPQTIAT